MTLSQSKLQNFFQDKAHEQRFWKNIIRQIKIDDDIQSIMVFNPQLYNKNKNDLMFLIISNSSTRENSKEKYSNNITNDPLYVEFGTCLPLYDDILFFVFYDEDTNTKSILGDIHPDDLPLFESGLIQHKFVKYSDGIIITKEDVPKAYLLLGDQ